MPRYRPAADVLRAEIDGEEVLLNTRTGSYHLINATGRSVLLALEEGLTLDETVQALAAEQSEPAERITADVESFVEAMCARGLLEVHE